MAFVVTRETSLLLEAIEVVERDSPKAVSFLRDLALRAAKAEREAAKLDKREP